VVERWAQDVCFQFFSGQKYFEHRLPCDPSQIGRFRRVLGEAGVEQLLKTTIETAVRIQAIKKSEFERVIVDTTVQEKAIAHPTDSRLLEVARRQLAELAKKLGVALKQTFEREGQMLRRKAGGYAHARQFKRLKKVLRRQRTVLGALMRDVQRKMADLSETAQAQLQWLLDRVARVHAQTANKANASGRGKLYALDEPEVACIGKSKARNRASSICSAVTTGAF
jgi:IS5 family transposase